jgi:cytochrome b6-f complex iron-sulfur subunit
VEVHRQGERVIARSLVCTHQGCTVSWREAEKRYRCPCQEAYFDENGQPLLGPVSNPLRELPVTIAAGVVTVTAPARD